MEKETGNYVILMIILLVLSEEMLFILCTPLIDEGNIGLDDWTRCIAANNRCCTQYPCRSMLCLVIWTKKRFSTTS